jgi:hypothetical protein
MRSELDLTSRYAVPSLSSTAILVPWFPSTVTHLNREADATNLQLLEYEVCPEGPMGKVKSRVS